MLKIELLSCQYLTKKKKAKVSLDESPEAKMSIVKSWEVKLKIFRSQGATFPTVKSSRVKVLKVESRGAKC